jgi:hypothetical protein
MRPRRPHDIQRAGDKNGILGRGVAQRSIAGIFNCLTNDDIVASHCFGCCCDDA